MYIIIFLKIVLIRIICYILKMFHCFIHVRDPIPFIFRTLPRMQVLGKLIMITELGDLSLISNDIFQQHEWKIKDSRLDITSSIKTVKSITDKVQEAIQMKKYHSMDNYFTLLSDSFQLLQNINIPKNRLSNQISNTDLTVPSSIIDCEGKILHNNQLSVIVKGEHLKQFTVASLELNNDVNMVVHSYLSHPKENGDLEINFILPKDLKLNSSKALLKLSNYFYIVEHKCSFQFYTVWLVGSSGAGKSQLRKTLEAVDTNLINEPSVHVVPDKHHEFERSHEQNQIHYYEFNGFTKYDALEERNFLKVLETQPPNIILILIKITETVSKLY